MRRALVLVALLVLAACSSGDDAYRVERAVEYTPGRLLDIYWPVRGTAHPAVVLVHGGGFTIGARTDMEPFAERLAAAGIVAATIDYQLSEGSWFPATSFADPGLRQAVALARDDALAAVGWLQASAAGYGVDPRRVVVAGYSAGAMTAIEAATHGPTVAGGFSIAGAGVELAAIDPSDPPLALVHGDNDDIIPASLALATCEQARLVQARCELVTRSGVGHEIAAAQLDRMVELLELFVVEVPARG